MQPWNALVGAQNGLIRRERSEARPIPHHLGFETRKSFLNGVNHEI